MRFLLNSRCLCHVLELWAFILILLIAPAMNIAYLLWTKFLADAERANIGKVRDFVISVEGKYKVSKNLCQTGLILNELQELNMEILEMCHHSPTYLWTIKRHLH